MAKNTMKTRKETKEKHNEIYLYLLIKWCERLDPYGDDDHWSNYLLELVRTKTDEEFNLKFAHYKQRLAKYNKWYEENKEIIHKEEERRKKKAISQEEEYQQKLREQIKTQEQKLKHLKERLK